MKNVVVAASVAVLLAALIGPPVLAQRNNNPNLRNFYMARQQVQILDEAPAVNDLRSNPAAAGQAPAVPAPGQGLPRAGFMSNMNAYHGGGAGGALPQVNNGVPARLPQTANGLNNGLKAGNAGKLKMKAPVTAKAKAPVVKAYKPYATTPVASHGGNSGSLLNTNTAVRGSVLHWNRHH